MKANFKPKKAVAIILAGALCLSMAACSDKETAKETKGSGEMPETLTVYAPISSIAAKAGATSRGDQLMYQFAEEKTGCKIEWISPNPSAAIEQFNLLIAGGEIPDILNVTWVAVGGVERWYNEGLVVNLKDYADNMPNLQKIIKERPDVAAQFVQEDGSFFSAPHIRKDKELLTFAGPLIRKDWLDKLGLDMPTNTDELYEVLKAFKTQDPNGNGKADEIPFTGMYADHWAFGPGNIVQAFGTYYSYYVKDGKVTLGFIEPEMKDALAYLSKLYKEGLIDPDFVSQTQDAYDARILNDRSGFWYGLQPTAYEATMNDGTKNVVAVPYFDNKAFHTVYLSNITSDSPAITTACKNPAGAAKWIDFFYSDECVNVGNFGKEGLTYEMVNGKPTMIKDFFYNNPDGKDSSELIALNLEVTNTNFAGVQLWDGYSNTLSNWGKNAIEVWAETADTSGALPNILLSAEEKAVISSKETDIQTYMSDLFNSIIIGNKPLSALDNAEKELNKLGLQEVLAAKTAAYKRYMARQ